MNQAMELLLGSRGRPARLRAMMNSARALAAWPGAVRFRVRVDEDDPELPAYRALAGEVDGLILHTGPRWPVPKLTAALAIACETELMMLGCADDILFRTPDWDARVRQLFAQWPDGLLVAATDDQDGRPQRKCQHFFTTKSWLAAVGFSGWSELEHFGVDHWHERVAQKASRMVYLDVVAEHMHKKHRNADGTPKGQDDETYRAKRRPAPDGRSPSDRDIARLTAGERLMDEQAATVRGLMKEAA